MKNSCVSIVALLFLIGCGTPAIGQINNSSNDEPISYAEGLFVNPHYGGYAHAVEDYQIGVGQGIGVKVGYGFTSVFTMYFGLDGAVMQIADKEDKTIHEFRELKRYIYPLAILDLGGQLNFRVGTSELVPYLDGSLNVMVSSYETEYGYGVFAGDGISFGGGFKYYLSPEVALDGMVGLSGGTYETLGLEGQTKDVNLGVLAAEIQVGFSWYPFAE